MDYTYYSHSPLGGMTLACDGDALTGLWFDGPKFSGTLSSDREERFSPVFAETLRWLDVYFSGHEPHFTPQLSLKATAFRQSVWKILLTIPYGQTMTYGEIARELRQMSARAVGSAIGHNPIALIVPCHRVIGANGRLTGYAGGLHRKQYLLALESVSRTGVGRCDGSGNALSEESPYAR